MAYKRLIILAMLIALLVASCNKHYTCNMICVYNITNNTDNNMVFDYEYATEEKYSERSFNMFMVLPWGDTILTRKDTTYPAGLRISRGKSTVAILLRQSLPPHTSWLPVFTSHEGASVNVNFECNTINSRGKVYRTLYNIDDTTSITQYVDYKWLDNFDGPIDKLMKHDINYYNSKDSIIWQYTLTITDSVLGLMHKDTTMLRLFPEYYGGSDNGLFR